MLLAQFDAELLLVRSYLISRIARNEICFAVHFKNKLPAILQLCVAKIIESKWTSRGADTGSI